MSMYTLARFSIFALAWAFMTVGSAFAAPCDAPDNVTQVTGGQECLVVKTYEHKGDSGQRVLFVLLHGNHTSGSPATSQFSVADELARSAPPNTVAVAMIRPGYNDADGNYSSGNAAGRGDNFTAENIDVVAGAIATLKAFHAAARVVLVGHSGGAAMAGVMLGRHPRLADAAVLVACPCDVPRWRAMSGRRGSAAWASESPNRYVDRIPADAGVSVLVGSDDSVTAPALSRSYVDALVARGITAELIVIERQNHVDVIGSPLVVKAALRLGRGG